MAVSEKAVIRKLTWRLLPILILSYFLSSLDRGNIGIAALTMRSDIGLSAEAFGFAVGLYSLPYILFEIPSNLALERFGARWWIARIMFMWGIVSGAHALAWSPGSLYAMRAMLGAAEAGLFPGILFYLTLWYPASYRSRITSIFMTAIPAAFVIGSPISTLFLKMDGLAGLHGWQWVFVLSALPTVALSICIPFILPSHPKDAKFLTDDERNWLIKKLEEERGGQSDHRNDSHNAQIFRTLFKPQVLLFALMYFGTVNLSGATAYFLPQIIRELGFGQIEAGFLSIIPQMAGIAGMLMLGWMADLRGKRRLANYVALFISLTGLIASASTDDPALKLLALTYATFGMYGAIPIFWGLPTSVLRGSAAAGGIALINSLGQFSGILNPWMMGLIRDKTASYNGGLLWLALMTIVAIVSLTMATFLFRPELDSSRSRETPVGLGS